MRLSKEQSRKRYSEMRELWAEWDPIGVFSLEDPWPRDEYDAYLGPTLRHLESGASIKVLEEYLAFVELEHMGLSNTKKAAAQRLLFAARLREWFEKYWTATHV